TVKAPRFDKNRPVTAPGMETVSADIPRSSPQKWNVPLILISALAIIVSGWLFASLREQKRLARRSQDVLVAAMRDRSKPQPVRMFAIHSLGEMGHEAHDSLKPLLDALTDADANIQIEAAKAIGRIGTGDPYLIAELQKIRKETEVSNVSGAIEAA